MKRLLSLALLAACAVAIGDQSAQAGPTLTLGFEGVSNNNLANVAIGESQMSLIVSDSGGGLVRFDFHNSGPENSSITDIYFDDSVDPSLFVTPITSIDDSDAGVEFSEDASPGNLPGGNDIGFNATKGLTADSDAPVSHNGVNPGETLGVVLTLDNGHTYGDVLSSLSDGSLRVGIRVQAFDGGGSESFVNGNGGPPAIPEPSSMAILGIGLAGVVTRFRRRRSQV